MFLVDKYYNDKYYLPYYNYIIDKLINSFDSNNNIYNNINSIIKLSNDEFKNIIDTLYYENHRFSHFQHLIIYGQQGACKEYIIDKLLEIIFGKSGIELKDIEYIVSGYSNTKTKITIKQSKYHIIIEPNSNGFDKYLIQEIIQEYAKSQLLNILKNKKLFKIVVINKIDNLSYYAQASLRRTMEKYSNTCKFILVSNQLTKIIEPLRSRCLLIRIPLPNNNQILETLLYIIENENIIISFRKLNEIIDKSENVINHAIWLLEMHMYKIKYENSWDAIINDIIKMIINQKLNTEKKLYKTLNKIREKFYLLFITNISTQLIIRKIMLKLLNKINNIELRYKIINLSSIFELKLNQGTRHIIQFEAYILRLIYLIQNTNKQYIFIDF
jgi:replication factor C subunit 3/5